MKRFAKEVDSGLRKKFDFSATVTTSKPIGEGLVRIGAIKDDVNPIQFKGSSGTPSTDEMERRGVKHFSDIRDAFFVFRYQNGHWYERTAYPNVRKAFEESVRSGPVIEL